jgi:2-oxoisovalerate dehydrogenase E2 component (dihydrolipoyl transacylase)
LGKLVRLIVLTSSYQHTLDLTALIPYLRQANAPAEKAPYRSPDFPAQLQSTPSAGAVGKTTILSFIVKALLLALDEHPAMRGMIVDNGTEQWLEVRRDPVVSIAVSGTSTPVRAAND